MSDVRSHSLHPVDALLDPARERQRVAGVAADEAGRARDPVGDDVRAEAARLLHRPRARAAATRSGRPRCARAGRRPPRRPAPGLDDLAARRRARTARARSSAARPRPGSRRCRSPTRPRSRTARGRRVTAPSRPSASRRACDRGGVVLAGESRHDAEYAGLLDHLAFAGDDRRDLLANEPTTRAAGADRAPPKRRSKRGPSTRRRRG